MYFKCLSGPDNLKGFTFLRKKNVFGVCLFVCFLSQMIITEASSLPHAIALFFPTQQPYRFLEHPSERAEVQVQCFLNSCLVHPWVMKPTWWVTASVFIVNEIE